jgi:hypothetical protein
MPEYSNLLQIDASAVRLQIVSKTVAARSHERSFAVVDGQLIATGPFVTTAIDGLGVLNYFVIASWIDQL